MLKLIGFIFISSVSFAETYRYISIPSGGMLGLIPISLLQKIEAETGKPMHLLVDGMAGASTGAIISALLASGYSAEDIKGFYQVKAAPIFEDAVNNVVQSLVGKFSGTKPDFSKAARELKQQTEFVFGERRVSDSLTDLTIIAHDKSKNKIVFFDKEDDVLMSDAVRASASVADAFGPVQITANSQKDTYVDASSLGINSPVSDPTEILAAKISKKLGVNDQAVIYLLETGFMSNYPRITDARITLIKIAPSIDSLLIGIKNEYVSLAQMFAPAEVPLLKKNFLAADVTPETAEKMFEIARSLEKTPAFQSMLEDLKQVSSNQEL